MNLHQPEATCPIPDGEAMPQALSQTSHLSIAAHQDDLELLAYHGIHTCFQDPEQWFTGVVVTNGKNSPRIGPLSTLFR